MTITIQWIEGEGGAWESAEGRFVIFPHINGSYVRDRLHEFIHAHPEDCPTQIIDSESEVFATEEECQRWAHQRLESYWQTNS